MKLVISTALLFVLAGAPAYAQDQEKDKPAQEQKKQEPAAKEHPQQQEQQKSQAEHQQKSQDQQQKQEQQKNESKQQAAKQQQQAAHQQQQQVARQDHSNSQQAQRDGGNRSAHRISEQEFHQHFGHEHQFRVTRSDDRRFSYGGYYWVYNDPWPSGWAY